MSFTSSSFNL